MLVDFMIIGAQKCGTTSLASQLASHPKICFCREKEPGYFNQRRDWQAKIEAYHALYKPSVGQLCGEASTMYTFFPESLHTAQNLFEYNPMLKFIYIMRDPIERIISNYSHELVRDKTRQPPASAVLSDPTYVNRSRYAVQLRQYFKFFPPDQLMLIVFEEYIANPIITLKKIAAFLHIAPNDFDTLEIVAAHKSTGSWQLRNDYIRKIVKSSAFETLRPTIPAGLRHSVKRLFSSKLDEKPHFSMELQATLRQLVIDDIIYVEQLLGRSVEAWDKECTNNL